MSALVLRMGLIKTGTPRLFVRRAQLFLRRPGLGLPPQRVTLRTTAAGSTASGGWGGSGPPASAPRWAHDGLNTRRAVSSLGSMSAWSTPTPRPWAGAARGLAIVCAARTLGELYQRQVTFDDVDVKFARSGGAGGQNVNKVNTKVDMRLKLSSATFLSEELRQGIRTRERNRVNSNDELVIMSTRHRTQGANKDDALDRMQQLIHDIADSLVVKDMTAEQAKKQAKMQRRANFQRLDNKKAQSKKKAERRRTDW